MKKIKTVICSVELVTNNIMWNICIDIFLYIKFDQFTRNQHNDSEPTLLHKCIKKNPG